MIQAPSAPWKVWLILGSRGIGKTRAAAEFINHAVSDLNVSRIALIGPTMQHAASVMVTGLSGLLSCQDVSSRPAYQPSFGEVKWSCGTVGLLCSADDLDRIRGFDPHLLWGDCPETWPRPLETWDQIEWLLGRGNSHCVLTALDDLQNPLIDGLVNAAQIPDVSGVYLTHVPSPDQPPASWLSRPSLL